MSNIKAGGAYVELTVKDKLKQGLDNARTKLDSFATAFSAATGGFLGGFLGTNIGSIIGKVGDVLGMADSVSELSSRIGISAESYQELSHAAGMSKSSIEEVSGALSKFRSMIGKAEMGNAAAINTLNKYGLSLNELKAMSPDKQLEKLADVINSMPDDATRAAAAIELLGKGAVGLLPMLSQGSSGIAAMREQARALGLATKNEDIERAAKLADVWKTIKNQVFSAGATIYMALVPALEATSTALRGTLAWTIALIDKNRWIVQTFFAVVSAVGMATVTYGAYQLSAYGAAAAMAVYTTATLAANSATMIFNAMTGGIPLLIGSIISALAAATVGVLVFSGAFNGVASIASQAMQGVYDAIAGGNLTLAFEIVTKGMHLAWVVLTDNMYTSWSNAISRLMDMLNPLHERLIEISQGFNIITGGISPEISRGTRKQNFDSNLPPSQQSRLRTELESLLKQATKEREKLEPNIAPIPQPAFDIEGLLASLDKKQAAGGISQSALSGYGYFSSASAGMMAMPAVRVAENQLNEQKKTNDLLEKIEENTEEEEAVFN